ncbi:MAG: 50S ribosomal protein L23 [Hyphomicrobium sp.]
MTKLNPYDVIISPIITEKSTQVSEVNQVIFKVAFMATKKDIKNSIEALFKVKVKAVNTLLRKGKKKIFKGRVAQLSDTKKAIVTLEAGHSIDLTTGL